MSKTALMIAALAAGLLGHPHLAMASTGTVFQCKVQGEPDVQVYMDATGDNIAVEQNGVTSPDTRGQNGTFRIAFAGGSFVFVAARSGHTGTITIARSQGTRTGTCS